MSRSLDIGYSCYVLDEFINDLRSEFSDSSNYEIADIDFHRILFPDFFQTDTFDQHIINIKNTVQEAAHGDPDSRRRVKSVVWSVPSYCPDKSFVSIISSVHDTLNWIKSIYQEHDDRSDYVKICELYVWVSDCILSEFKSIFRDN